MATKKRGVLVMDYGTPKTLDEVPAYYTHIRHGHPPTKEQLDELLGRYKAIGGQSPLNDITDRQADGIGKVLNGGDEAPFAVYLGHKHAAPFIEDAVDRMQDDGVEQAVALVLAPHYANMSVGDYFGRVRSRIRPGGPEVRYVESWYQEPDFVRFVAERVRRALDAFPKEEQDEVRVVFSAHSLPLKALENDPYPEQLHHSGDLIAREAGLRHWLFAWQSAGRTDAEWIGPDIRDVVKELRREGHANILVCPVGFVADHLEVLYDLDIEAQALARDLDVHLARTESPNDDERFTALLADVVRKRFAEPS